MEKQYIEIDSTYRNRNRWPNPSDFEVPISQSGDKLKGEALDPISSMTSVKSWKSNFFDSVEGGINRDEKEITLTIMDAGDVSNTSDNDVYYVYKKDYNILFGRNDYLIFRTTIASSGTYIHGYVNISTGSKNISTIASELETSLSDSLTGVQKFSTIPSDFQVNVIDNKIVIINNNDINIQFVTDPNIFVVTNNVSGSRFYFNGNEFPFYSFYIGKTYTFIMDYSNPDNLLNASDILEFYKYDSLTMVYTPLNPSDATIIRRYTPGSQNCTVTFIPHTSFSVYVSKISSSPLTHTYIGAVSTAQYIDRPDYPLTTILGFDETHDVLVSPSSNTPYLNYFPLNLTTSTVINPPNPVNSGLQRLDNFYNNAVLEYGTGNTFRRIKEYKYLQNGKGLLTLYKHPTQIYYTPDLTQITIKDPTDVKQGLIFVPNGSKYNNAYYGMKLVNLTLDEYADIISYNNTTNLLEFDLNTLSGDIDLWRNSHYFSISKQMYKKSENLDQTKNNNVMDSIEYYYKSFNLQNISNITAQNTINNFLEIKTNPFTGSVERQEITRFENISGTGYTLIDTNNIEIPLTTTGSSDINNYYQNMFITVNNGLSYDTHYITSYKVVTDSSGNIISKTITKSNNGLPFPASTNWSIKSGIVKNNFSVPLTNQAFKILDYTKDNFSPLNMNLTSYNSQSYYKVSLVNLIIPNDIVENRNGDSMLNYPYLYVEFTNNNNILHNKIYSNNPNSKKMLFRAILGDIIDIESSSFLKFNGDHTEQYLYFRPSDTIRFRILLPTGEIFTTVTQETFSPQEPEQLKQISAMFSIEKKV
jgi:hypothetical protein